MIRMWYVMVLVGFGGVLGNSAYAALEGSADFDLNGEVNELDFSIWEMNFPTLSGASLADGDADSNGTVDGNDFLLWQVQYLPSEVAPSRRWRRGGTQRCHDSRTGHLVSAGNCRRGNPDTSTAGLTAARAFSNASPALCTTDRTVHYRPYSGANRPRRYAIRAACESGCPVTFSTSSEAE